MCHKFLNNGSSFRLADLDLDPPEESRSSPMRRARRKQQWEGLARFIKGLEVAVNFDTKRRYPRRKILDIHPKAGRYQFVLERADKTEKRVVTVEVRTVMPSYSWGFSRPGPQEYYQMVYGKRMQCPDAIGVVTRRDPLSIIPIEFCRLSQQMYKKVLDPENTKLVLQGATKKPHDRFRAIEAARVRFLPPLSFATLIHPKMECAGSLPRSGLNAEINPIPIQIPARRLPLPDIVFGDMRTEALVVHLPSS